MKKVTIKLVDSEKVEVKFHQIDLGDLLRATFVMVEALSEEMEVSQKEVAEKLVKHYSEKQND